MGQVLGPAKGEGNEMAQWVLKANGNFMSRHNCHPLSVKELHSPHNIKLRETFDAIIQSKQGTSMTPPKVQTKKSTNDTESWEEYQDPDELLGCIPKIQDTANANVRLLCHKLVYNKLLKVEVLLQHGYNVQSVCLTQRSFVPDRVNAGNYNNNLNMNYIVYDL